MYTIVTQSQAFVSLDTAGGEASDRTGARIIDHSSEQAGSFTVLSESFG
jgi:hypothetical protein